MQKVKNTYEKVLNFFFHVLLKTFQLLVWIVPYLNPSRQIITKTSFSHALNVPTQSYNEKDSTLYVNIDVTTAY